MTKTLLAVALLLAWQESPDRPVSRDFKLASSGEVVATIVSACAECDWGVIGHEAVLLEVTVDGAYSQHIALVRGQEFAPYRIMLGRLAAGPHRLALRRDGRRSASRSGAVVVERIAVDVFEEGTSEHAWLARSPFLRARAGTVERFSDLPLVLYAEQDIAGEGGSYQLQYTAIFTNEDGGTPTDRLMATWGRTTDIEFVFGIARASGGTPRELMQAEGHEWVEFGGHYMAGRHPELWVATLNNMMADHGDADAVRFAPAPRLVSLGRHSREAVMDDEPWTYAVAAAEMRREGRVSPAARPRSGLIPDPRQFAVVEACADVTDAALAFDIGVREADGQTSWYATDRGEPTFRIARGGCVRGGAPLPPGARVRDIAALRVRAYPRPPREEASAPAAGSSLVTLREVRLLFMLDGSFHPTAADFKWTGALQVPLTGTPVIVPSGQ